MGRCQSWTETKTEYGDPYWPQCDLRAGHAGNHRHGHFMDVMWAWGEDRHLDYDDMLISQRDGHAWRR